MDSQHPLDERLAAFAAGDDDVMTDATLRAHATGCARCAPIVRDLVALRSSLAELPDLIPSRRLQLVPPVQPQPSAAGGFATLVRRLFAPAMAAGAVLVIAGTVGMAAPNAVSLATFGGAGAAATDMQTEATNDNASNVPVAAGASSPDAVRGPTSSDSSYLQGGGSSASQREDTGKSTTPSAPGPTAPMPWLAITILGAAIVIASLILRWTVVPAAGTRAPPF